MPQIPPPADGSTPAIQSPETVNADAGQVRIFRCPISSEAMEEAIHGGEDEGLLQNDGVLDRIEENKVKLLLLLFF